ncbi:hypothetical protein J3R74_001685 [Puniceicoccus vermicola]
MARIGPLVDSQIARGQNLNSPFRCRHTPDQSSVSSSGERGEIGNLVITNF